VKTVVEPILQKKRLKLSVKCLGKPLLRIMKMVRKILGFFHPKHTALSVAHNIRLGLEEGKIQLHDSVSQSLSASSIEHRSLLLRERQAVADQMITSTDGRDRFKLRQRLETIEQEIAQVNQSLESSSEAANSP
jgi:hypothetical protein